MIEIEAHLVRVEVDVEAGPHACHITNQFSARYSHELSLSYLNGCWQISQ